MFLQLIRSDLNPLCSFIHLTFNLEHLQCIAGEVMKLCIKFERNRAIRAWHMAFFDADTLCHAVALIFDLLTLNFCSTSGVMCLNSVQNLSEIEYGNPRLSYWWFSTFTACSFMGRCTFVERFPGVRGPTFTKLGDSIGRSSLLMKFISEFRYLAAFSNVGILKLSDVENDAKFRTFWPPSYENWERGGRDLWINWWSFTYIRWPLTAQLLSLVYC